MAGQKGRSGGHNRKPTQLKVITGTEKKERKNSNEPALKCELPLPPPWLSDEGRCHYERIGALVRQMRVVTASDGEALGLLADAYCEYLEYAQIVEDEGPIIYVTNKQGEEIPKTHPAARNKAQTWQRLRVMMTSFGLTPASRATVNAIPQVGDDGKKHKWR